MSSSSSFGSWSEYMTAMRETRGRLAERAAALGRVEVAAEAAQISSQNHHHVTSSNNTLIRMKRKLQWYDLVGLGVGGMVGAGVFVVTGRAAHDVAGPAIILSYAVAGVAALLSALCYTEFAVHVPAAGGAFTYLHITFGELAAYLTGANLIMEYVISNAAVARSFTSYLATVFSVTNPNAWRIHVHSLPPGYNMLDIPAVALIIIITLCICFSTKCSSTFNVFITALHLGLIAFMVLAGFAKGSPGNLSTPSGDSDHQLFPPGFAPYGARGVFNGAAIVYFSFIGYDTVSTMAEEVHKPSRTMRVGIAGSVLIVTFMYCLMAASLVILVPYDKIDVSAPFSLALRQKTSWQWASNVVGMTASIGILSSLLVAMLGQARYLCSIGRANLIPAWFGTINPRTATPLNSSLVSGACTAIVALFTEMDILIDLISIGTLFVFYMVPNALIFRCYVLTGTSNAWATITFLIAISSLSIGFACVWQLAAPDASADSTLYIAGLSLCAAAIVVVTLAFYMIAVVGVPRLSDGGNGIMIKNGASKAAWPLFLAVGSIFLDVFLAGSIRAKAFMRFGLWSACVLVFYVLYSVHATHDAARAHKSTAREVTLLIPPQSDGEESTTTIMPPQDHHHELSKTHLNTNTTPTRTTSNCGHLELPCASNPLSITVVPITTAPFDSFRPSTLLSLH